MQPPLGWLVTGRSGSSAPDEATVAEDSVDNAVDVLANDSDGVDDGETLTVTAVTQGTSGSVALTTDGTVSCTPNSDFFGTDSFTYRIGDGNGGSDTAVVDVTVTAVNDVPSFVKGADQSVNEDAGGQSVTGWASTISAGPANESG